MNDSVSMVFYAVDADVHGEYRKAIRRYRQMFFYKDGTLYQSRLYPADTGNALEVSKLFRHLVQKAISRCLTAFGLRCPLLDLPGQLALSGL